MLPNLNQIKQFIVGTIIPPIAGALATWVVGTHVLVLFNINSSEVAYEITQVLVFGVTTGIAWLSTHNILKGTYVGVK